MRGICEKPRIKCAECPNRRFLSLSERVIRWHLSGHDDAGQPFVAGIYPMLLDETCFFLAIDFDKQGWTDDARAFMETCHRMNVPAVLERSRSGRGGHVWIFFAEAIPAALARRLGSYVLTESMDATSGRRASSRTDRFFPSQDTLPHGGFGNLIALPLQKQAREHGNSVFVDEQLMPYADQWAFLSTIRTAESSRRSKRSLRRPSGEGTSLAFGFRPTRRTRAMEGAAVASAVSAARSRVNCRRHRIGPRQRDLHPEGRTESVASKPVVRLAAFQNPEFYKAQAMRLGTYGKPRIVSCAEDHSAHIGLPRGCLDDLCELLDRAEDWLHGSGRTLPRRTSGRGVSRRRSTRSAEGRGRARAT